MPGKLTEGVDEETKPKGTIPRLITSQNDTAPKHEVENKN